MSKNDSYDRHFKQLQCLLKITKGQNDLII